MSLEERLNGDVEKIKSLDEYVKKGVLRDIKTTYQKLISLEQKIATKEKVIEFVLQENTELRYWLREFETYEEIDKELKPQYDSEIEKNRRWKEMMRKDGYNQKQIEGYNQQLNNKIKEIEETYKKNYNLFVRAKDQLKRIDAYTSYLEIKKEINELRKFNLKFILVNRSGVFINLDEIINYNKDTRIKPTKRQLEKRETREKFLKRMKTIRPTNENKLKM
jgi:hypothetical protein